MMQMINPFTNIYADNPTLATFDAKALTGQSKELAESIIKVVQDMEAVVSKGFEGIEEIGKPLYKAMSDDISRQRKRLGGDFAVAHAIAKRVSRDYVRELLDNQVIFIVLNLTKECQRKRVKARHGEDNMTHMEDMFKLYEPGEQDEPDTYNVHIDEDETPD